MRESSAIIFRVTIIVTILTTIMPAYAQQGGGALMEVGVARADITPYGPIRLSGYLRAGSRNRESEGVLQPLWAKAIAFGSDAQHPSVLITVDLTGSTEAITQKVATYLKEKAGILPGHLAICASHTHSGPDMGSSHNMYSDPPLPPDQLARIAFYLDSLVPKLQKLAMDALKNRAPSAVSWSQGKVAFAVNRRVIRDGKWVGHGKVPDGPVDHSLPVLRVTSPQGKIKAILTSYACHGTTLFWDVNKTHGDWIGAAQESIEANHPGSIALVAVGCGGDSDPDVRGKLEHTVLHGNTIAREIERVMAGKMESLSAPPSVKFKSVVLPYDHVPGIEELATLAATKEKKGADTVNFIPSQKGFNAASHLDRLVRGIPVPQGMNYKVQSWTFGNKLSMLFLEGEVLAGYSLRLKKEMGGERLWINAYTNNVQAYIPTRRAIKEGGYEVEGSMYYYNHPFRFSEDIEEIIISAAHEVLSHTKPANGKKK